ncbi:type II toxin-antitoxin system death-on-curing family toxin [Sphingobacterium sp. KU25419]|nr:type II toxin-antitoxin system death-on-curing family toxin [Sphingobacterium sp. KU25419]
MDFEYLELEKEFERTLQNVDEEEFVGNNIVSWREVIKSHFLIADFFIKEGEDTLYGVKDFHLLGSTLTRQTTSFLGTMKWNTAEEICATLFFGLIKNHPFHDANKRTALLILIYHLQKLGRTITAKQKIFEDLAVNIAKDNYKEYKDFKRFEKMDDKEIHFIAYMLRKNTRQVDKRYYPITYQEFERLLRRHNYYLEVVTGNCVNVYCEIEEKKFFGLRSVKKRKNLIQIGFGGWKKKINPKAVKETLKACNLTTEYGVDSQAFFHEADPLNALIDEYQTPLKRLKNR